MRAIKRISLWSPTELPCCAIFLGDFFVVACDQMLSKNRRTLLWRENIDYMEGVEFLESSSGEDVQAVFFE